MRLGPSRFSLKNGKISLLKFVFQKFLKLSAVNKLVEIALKYEGFPSMRYISHGVSGNTPKAFDCSGYVQWIILKSGMPLPDVPNTKRPLRHSEEFFDFLGFAIHERAAAPGDLVFFSKNGVKPSHLGIYIGDGKMIHSPGMEGKKVCAREIDDFCVKNKLKFNPASGHQQIYFNNPIGYKRVALPSGERFQMPPAANAC